MTLPVSVRLKQADDVARVFSDWLRSYRNAPGLRQIPNEVYFYWQHRILESFWADPTCVFLVACDQNDPRKIYGWLCGQRADSLAGDQVIVHYVYVAKLYRRMGLARQLLATFDTRTGEGPKPVVVTAQTDAGRELLAGAGYDLVVYNPYLAWARAPALGSDPPKAVLKKKDPFAASRRELVVGGFARVPGEEEEST